MRFTSAIQLKDWIKNKSKQTGTQANVLLQTYMMERLLERISISVYRENLILKGGFLIAAMIGVDKRATMDMDTKVKGLMVNREEIQNILREIIGIDVDDSISFEILNINNIHDISEYDDFRVSLRANFQTIRVSLKIDITTGDAIIPHEIEYRYKLMFEDRTIPIMAYNLYTILAEKIETILSRNVTNSRGRDFYDIYTLLSMNIDSLSQEELLRAIRVKAEDRNSVSDVEKYEEHLRNIANSPEIEQIWVAYSKNYPYAKGIALSDILRLINWVFEAGKD